MTEQSVKTVDTLDDVLPKLRGAIWTAALTCSGICGLVVYFISRNDIASLRAELRQSTVTQTQHVSMSPQKNREDVIQEEMARIRTQREQVKGM